MSTSLATPRNACCLALAIFNIALGCSEQARAAGDRHSEHSDQDAGHHHSASPPIDAGDQAPGASEEDPSHVGLARHQHDCKLEDTPTENLLEVIRIGVLSPISGTSSSVGSPHEESIKLAHRLYGRGIRVGDSLVEIELVKRDYESDQAQAVEKARELVHANQVVALLGPVNSQAVADVVEELKGQHVAVLSALATAPSLTKTAGSNFFRVVFDDDTRMKQYATFIKGQNISGQLTVLFDEQSTYGRELCKSFKRHFKSENVEFRTWGWLAGSSTEFKDCEPVLAGPTSKRDFGDWKKRIEAGIGLNSGSEVKKKLAKITAAVLLGSSKGALTIADPLSTWHTPPQIFLVGSSRELFGKAPEGAFTIGDPKLDPYRAETPEEVARWTRLLRTYERQHFQSKDDFMPTAYDAYVAVHEALEIALNRHADGELAKWLQPKCLRADLLNTLESDSFDSITSWRKVSLDSRGSLEEDPIAPIYRIRRDAVRADGEGSHDWIEVEVDPNQSAYWGPVSVTLTPHGLLKGVPITLYLMRAEPSGLERVVEERLITFDSGPVVEDFYFLWEAPYFIRMSSDYNPANPGFVVEWTADYLVAFIVAILAGLLVAQHHSLRWGQGAKRVAGGAFAALALVGIAVFMNRWIQIPFLTGSPTLTALVIGLLSGSAGPTLVVGILERFASRVTGPTGGGPDTATGTGPATGPRS